MTEAEQARLDKAKHTLEQYRRMGWLRTHQESLAIKNDWYQARYRLTVAPCKTTCRTRIVQSEEGPEISSWTSYDKYCMRTV